MPISLTKKHEAPATFGFQGFLFALISFPFVLIYLAPQSINLRQSFIAACFASSFLFIAGYSAHKNILAHRLSFITAFILSAFTLSNTLTNNPLWCLVFAITTLSCLYLSFEIVGVYSRSLVDMYNCQLIRIRILCKVGICFILVAMLCPLRSPYQSIIFCLPTFWAYIFVLQIAVKKQVKPLLLFSTIGILAIIAALYFSRLVPLWLSCWYLLVILFLLPQTKKQAIKKEQWWEPLVHHPARIIIISFASLSFLGSFMLLLPYIAKSTELSYLDALFTSVSAVCVTGLSTLDITESLSFTGQIILLFLIQVGGLGIMTLTTLVMSIMGKRLSVKQENALKNENTQNNNLLESLLFIVQWTFIVELIGASLLTCGFLISGNSFGTALWHGIFISISAFCNAGFSPLPGNLTLYTNTPFILDTVSLLIILGGIAPITAFAFPKWIAGKKVRTSCHLALSVSIILLLTGWISLCVFEWNGIFAGLSISAKLHNAWFQSATLRTAGFNSVPFTHLSDMSFLLMIGLMFIGGSPGGTAGGIKTTTLAVFFLVFSTHIRGQKQTTVCRESITYETLAKAITILVAGIGICILFIFMLDVTQSLPLSQIVFEVVSALSTVGLSLGATTELDGIGKIVIILAMFIGRVGPITLFMLLSRSSDPERTYVKAVISLS